MDAFGSMCERLFTAPSQVRSDVYRARLIDKNDIVIETVGEGTDTLKVITAPTPTPTLPPGAPTSTPTPAPGDVTLSFDLALEGILAGRNDAPSKRVTLEVLNKTTNTVKVPENVIPVVQYKQADGRFKRDINIGNTLSPNTDYIFRIKIDGYLKKESSVIHIDDTTKPQTKTIKTMLLGGDINNDGVVDPLDYNLVHDCYGSKFFRSVCKNKAADIDRDVAVTIIDFNIVVRNINKKDEIGI